MEVSGQLHAPAALPPGTNPAIHWIQSEQMFLIKLSFMETCI